MRIAPSRRAFLKLAAAGLIFSPAAVPCAETSALAAEQLWTTGNNLLRPLAHSEGRIHFCGDINHGAIDAARGIVWTQKLQAGQTAQFRPRLDNGRVAIGGHHGIAMYDATSGEPLWQHNAKLQLGTPLLVSDTLYCGEGHEILAIDAASGEVKWRYAGIADTLASYAPLLVGDTLFSGPGDGHLYALDAHNGTLKWQLERSADWQYLRQLHASDTTLVAGSYKEKLFGLSLDSGEPLWEFNAGNFINSHMVSGKLAYLWSPTGYVYAIDTDTGSVRWRHQTTDFDGTPSNWGSLMAELIVSDGKLLCLDMKDDLHVLDAKTGAYLQRLKVPARILNAVLPLGQDKLLFPTRQGEVLMASLRA